ncbi:MAG: prepilin-type N-terminal cleavage/methylation domain-containing protein [Candidatus Aminicenantes bacterium]|nr:prepilin-type N-terminal cleavage/methylation domain-containing protein [Candidatus Aminicenantes bacterium]
MKNNSTDFTSKGYSLIEVLICLFIFSIMIGLSSTSFLSLSPKYKLQKAAWEIRSRLNFARYKAIFEGEKVRVSIDSPGYKIEQYDENQKIWVVKLENILDGVSVEANNSPLFHPGGTVSNLASIYVTNSWGQYKITIAITGRIKVVPN